MKISEFFVFETKHLSSTFQAASIELKTNQYGVDDHDSLIGGKYDGINFPVVFKQDYGKKLTDILGTGWPSLYLISDKLKTILEEHEITGWKTFPIKLYDKKGNEILGYQGFSVTGRCGRIDYKKAEIFDRQSVPTGPVYRVYKGLYIGLDEWDGMDFFIPEKSRFIITAKKPAEILLLNKITNLDLEDLGSMEMRVNSVLNKD